ncbi:Serine/threonine-protein kinase PknH [Aquisphaera giovannonii]|uniref:Serine/threonine-protein kinase PknH n=2 Tax=Aquisphaera giovannonii TaxID=406548 RepID=A0A5B9VXC5_9BACT|nr:Serine/threonine-protein kinase PknH [Aquisphaera giovannonii]
MSQGLAPQSASLPVAAPGRPPRADGQAGLVRPVAPPGANPPGPEAIDGIDILSIHGTGQFASPAGEETAPSRPDAEAEEFWAPLLDRTIANYQILSEVGRGSMGRVYRARHLGLGRVSAVKIMSPRMMARHSSHRGQFWAEARAAANLVHPHVVMIHNLGTERGYHFIEMEYVDGAVSLRDCLIRNGPFRPAKAARLVRQVALALEAAHRSGLIHRDVKPANVLLTPDGHAKLADFGLAQSLVGLTADRLAGTPTFMAPELFGGRTASRQSDIYAAGVMIYYLVSGLLPFASGNIRSLIRLHQAQPVPDLRPVVPGMPEPLIAVIERCLAKSPADRYASAQELAEELRRVVQHLRDTEELIRESVRGLDCFLQGSRESFRIILPQSQGERLQEVLVEVNDGSRGERFLTVFSVCGPAEPRHYGAALAMNARLTYGSLSIRHVLGSPMLVMSRTFPRDQVRASELRDAILEIGRKSDQIEQQITRLDAY